MKKQILAGAGIVAALGVAALPVATFAATTYTETVQATVSSTCGLLNSGSEVTNDSIDLGSIANGSSSSKPGQTVQVVCNNTSGWTLSAVGSGAAEGNVASMDASTKTADDIATGTTTASYWNYKFGVTGSASTTLSEETAIPTSATAVAKASAGTDSTSTVTPTYTVAISSTQAAGTYTGKVTYTLAANAQQ